MIWFIKYIKNLLLFQIGKVCALSWLLLIWKCYEGRLGDLTAIPNFTAELAWLQAELQTAAGCTHANGLLHYFLGFIVGLGCVSLCLVFCVCSAAWRPIRSRYRPNIGNCCWRNTLYNIATAPLLLFKNFSEEILSQHRRKKGDPISTVTMRIPY